MWLIFLLTPGNKAVGELPSHQYHSPKHSLKTVSSQLPNIPLEVAVVIGRISCMLTLHGHIPVVSIMESLSKCLLSLFLKSPI